MAKKKARGKKDTEPNAFERRMKDFGEEVGDIGEKFGRRMERHGKRLESRGKVWEGSVQRTFGLVWPLMSSIIGIIIFVLLTWVISLVNSAVHSWIITELYSFLSANTGIFFLLFLFFSYTSYFSRFHRRIYRLFSPFSVALGATVCFWIAASMITTVNTAIGSPALSTAAYYISQGLFIIFWLFLTVGYLVLVIILATEKTIFRPAEAVEEAKPPSASAEGGGMHRLYRSGRDRVLGGVCGGIAEYLGVDPVIIRLLWVIGTLAWGFGILLYIICWIVIPRNPGHKWK